MLYLLTFVADNARRRSENDTSSSDTPENSLKILYTPYTNVTLAVIQKANRTFDTAGQIIALADDVANCTQFFLENFPPNSSALDGLREVCFLM